MFDAQLEMSFESGAVCFSRRQRRLTRAQWWFQRMRRLVDSAIDWQPAPLARPEQMWLPSAGTPPELASATESNHALEQRQICE